MELDGEPIVTVEEARIIMGDDAVGMSDEELKKLITQLNSLARAYVLAVQSGYIGGEPI